MLFQKRPIIELGYYKKDKGTFHFVSQDQKDKKYYFGHIEGGELFYIGKTFDRQEIVFEKIKKTLHIVEASVAGVGAIVSFILFIFFYLTNKQVLPLETFIFGGSSVPLFFWVSICFITFAGYITTNNKRDIKKVFQFSKNQKNKRSKKAIQAHDITASYSDQSLFALNQAYIAADEHGDDEVTVFHVFYGLLQLSEVQAFFVRLGSSPYKLKRQFEDTFAKQKNHSLPKLSKEVYQIIFQAYRQTQSLDMDMVRPTELLEEVIRNSQEIQDLLYDFGVDEKKLEHVINWVHIQERLREQYKKFKKSAALRSKHGMDRAMTAIATPYLDSFSKDITHLAKMGYLEPCVARDNELESIYRMLQSGVQGVLLVGEAGVGKGSIVDGIAQNILQNTVPEILFDKRLIELSVSQLLAGTTMRGAQERLIGIMNEVSQARNIVLFINNIHDLFDMSGSGLDVSETLAEYLSSGRFVTIATTNQEGFTRVISNSTLSTVLGKVDIQELSVEGSIEAIESKIGYVEYKHKVFFSFDAINKSVQLASRFLKDIYLPASALNLISEVAIYTKQKHGEHAIVNAEDVSYIIAQKTGVPITTVSQDESGKLLQLEQSMHEQVIGQDEAVSQVANALRRARAEMRATNKPIATFLFLGPTGVGKTELAKTIAKVYFGGEERMIRIDMSEYQDKGSIYRLIGKPGEKGTGILTEAIRQKPFSLILLDEMEKADKDVLNLFLQVFDDGRLTDSIGRTVDFTNAIIIATSNAGTSFVQHQIQKGVDDQSIKTALINTQLKQYYSPEFLNRFDGITLFKTLSRDDIKKVSKLMLHRVKKDLEARGVFLRVEDSALEHLADIGYDPQFGARPMRRAIQDTVENKLAELILGGNLKRKDTVVLNGSSLIVEEAA